MTITVGSTFSGYDGLALAVDRAFNGNTKLQFVADVAEGPCKILAHRHPDVPNLGDITTIDWSAIPQVDILIGGFPCFTAGTPVLTARGFTAIEDVFVGDLVLTHQNRWRTVTATMNRVVNKTVEFAPGMFSTPEHRIWARTHSQEWRNDTRRYKRVLANPEWVEAQNLRDKFTARPIAVPVAPGADPEVKPAGALTWWQVGRWIADGWTAGPKRSQVYIAIGKGKEADLDRLPGWTLRVEGPITKARMADASAAEWLRTHFGHRAHGKTIPAWALSMPREDRSELLAGYLSGDGSTAKSGRRRSLSVSANLTYGLRALTESLGHTTCVSHHIPPATKVIEGRTVNQSPYWTLDANDDTGRYTERDGVHAWAKWRSLRNGSIVHGETIVYDLTVDEDHSFIAAGTVVHNCQDMSVAGARAGMYEGTRSGLFFDLLRGINTMRPRLVILENVPGIFTAWGEPPNPEYVAADTEVQRLNRAISTVEARYNTAIRKGQAERARRKPAEKHRLLRALRVAMAERQRAERLIRRAIDVVLGSLAEIGFDAEYGTCTAAAAGAAHKRERWFLIAWPTGTRPPNPGDYRREGRAERDSETGTGGDSIRGMDVDGRPLLTFPTPTASDYKGGVRPDGRTRGDGRGRTAGDDRLEDRVLRLLPTPTTSNAAGNDVNSRGEPLLPGLAKLLPTPTAARFPQDTAPRPSLHGFAESGLFPTPRASDGAGGNNPLTQPAKNDDVGTRVARLMPTPKAPDGAKGGPNQHGSKGDLTVPSAAPRWEDYTAALEQAANVLGRPHPTPTEPAPRGGQRLNPAFSEWLMMLPDGWVCDTPGLTRNEQLTAIGNGVVPPQAEYAIRTLLGRVHN